MQNVYGERMATAKEIAETVIILCDTFSKTPNQTTMNLFLASVERLANLAEDIEVQQTLKALDA